MSQRGRRWWGSVLFGVSVGACGHDLQVPTRPSADGAADQPPSAGITALGGADDGSEHTGKLPVIDPPSLGGGAAGDSAARAPDDVVPSGGEGGNAGHGSTSPRGAEAPALLISEYLEGIGKIKAIELYAISGGSLDRCQIHTYFNGKLEPSRLALRGELEAGAVHVLCSAALAQLEPERCDRATHLTFNGDDALAITCDGKRLDVFGQIGVDPGESWGGGVTVDHDLRRLCNVSGAMSVDVLGEREDDHEPWSPLREWSSASAEDFTDLGHHACGE